MAKKGLGRGLDALLSDNTLEKKESVTVLRVADIEPNKSQARKKFDQAALSELAASISRHGLIQPIAVRAKDNGFYEIIAGERRWRASKMAGLTEIPVVIMDASDMNAAEMSLVENLQRENLNPVEEAKGYQALIEQFDLTQEEASERVGKSRAAVTNIMRILKLPEKTLALVEEGTLSAGHARTLVPLVGVYGDDEIYELAVYVKNGDISVRDTEKLVKNKLYGAPKKEPESAVKASYYKQLEKNISASLGRKVTIKSSENGKGTLSLAYFSTDDFEALLKSICGNEIFELN